MEKLCPVCNALQKIHVNCRQCGTRLINAGPLSDFNGPYSPYNEIELPATIIPDTHCIHLLFCPNCGYDTKIACQLVII